MLLKTKYAKQLDVSDTINRYGSINRCHLQICEVQIRFCSMWKVCSFAQFVLRTILLNENIKNNLDCEHIVYYFFVCLFIFFPQSQFTELNPGSGGVYSAKIHDGIRETLSGYGI